MNRASGPWRRFYGLVIMGNEKLVENDDDAIESLDVWHAQCWTIMAHLCAFVFRKITDNVLLPGAKDMNYFGGLINK